MELGVFIKQREEVPREVQEATVHTGKRQELRVRERGNFCNATKKEVLHQ